MILAEVEKEVQAYLKHLETTSWWVNLAMGVLSVIPGGGVLAALGQGVKKAIMDGKRKQKGYGKNATLTQQEISLQKYGPGKIEVKLCFGLVVIPLGSKIKIAS